MRFAELPSGIRMHYGDIGSGDPILFLPGFAARLDTWNCAVLDLEQRHRCVCVIDADAEGRIARMVMVAPATPRFTRTEAEPYGITHEAALDTLEGIRRSYPETMAPFADANFHPTALFHGRHDPVCDAGWVEYMAARIPGARVVWFEHSSHCLMLEEPDRFSHELAQFVETTRRPA